MKKLGWIFAMFLLMVSCSDDNESTSGSSSHRISQVFYEATDDSDYKYEFTYDGDKLIKYDFFNKDDNGEWYETYKTEISYSGTHVSEVCYKKVEDTFLTFSKSEYEIENGLTLEEYNYDYYNDAWVGDWKWTYQYSGKNITAWQSYDQVGTSLIQDGKGEFVYLNGQISQYIVYAIDEAGNAYQSEISNFTYEGNHIQSYTLSQLNDENSMALAQKNEYVYEGDKVSQIMYYVWDTVGNQWVSNGSVSFSYDGDGCLAKEAYQGTEVAEYEYEYKYEKGTGNAIFFWVYPEIHVYGIPMLQSTIGSSSFVPYKGMLK